MCDSSTRYMGPLELQLQETLVAETGAYVPGRGLTLWRPVTLRATDRAPQPYYDTMI